LGKSVIGLEIMTVAGRTSGVEFVQDVYLAQSAGAAAQIEMTGLQLPRVLGISVVNGPAMPLDELRGTQTPSIASTGAAKAPLPVIPQECT
jgi:hypothetical protein